MTLDLGDESLTLGSHPTNHDHRHADEHDDTNADNQAHTGGMVRLAGVRNTTVMRRGRRTIRGTAGLTVIAPIRTLSTWTGGSALAIEAIILAGAGATWAEVRVERAGKPACRIGTCRIPTIID